jgi:hypothetical protein
MTYICIREMELVIVEENVNLCERNEERHSGRLCYGPEGALSHKAVREQAVKVCGTAEVVAHGDTGRGSEGETGEWSG